ncbi:MAG: hypothetical protein U0842_28565 [Candidatus Binatia bacterium]
MLKHTKKVMVGVAALAAMALGGSALAQAGNPPAKPAPASTPATAVNQTTTGSGADNSQGGDQSASDTDNVRSGDQSAPDTTSATGDKESSSSEQSDAGEQPDTPGENVGSETPGNDGPGGHADEPGNAGADHQFEGQE